MDHLTALAAAVAANPGDRHTRLVLADALEELGRTGAAEVLRQSGYWVVVNRKLWWTNNSNKSPCYEAYPFVETPDIREAVVVHQFDAQPLCQRCPRNYYWDNTSVWHTILFGWVCFSCAMQYQRRSPFPCLGRYP